MRVPRAWLLLLYLQVSLVRGVPTGDSAKGKAFADVSAALVEETVNGAEFAS